MSSPLVIPFNFDAGTTTKKTSSYTVGSGKYCWAIPLDVKCTVNSTRVFSVSTYRSFTSAANNKYYLAPDNFTGTFETSVSANTTFGKFDTGGAYRALIGPNIASLSLNQGVPDAPTAFVVTTNLSPGWYTEVTAIANFEVRPVSLVGTWYKAGDVLTGGDWLVTEYNSVT